METAFSMALGVGLSAACGFRVFVPLVVISIAASTGHLTLSPGFEWMGSPPATIAFGSATVVEVLAYYIPWLDHLLDIVATPAAVVAGVVASAASFTEMSPLLRWTLALVGGGGVAGLVQAATVVTRSTSTALSGGFGGPIVSTAELVGSVATSLVALIAPVLCVAIISAGLYVVYRIAGRVRGRHQPTDKRTSGG